MYSSAKGAFGHEKKQLHLEATAEYSPSLRCLQDITFFWRCKAQSCINIVQLWIRIVRSHCSSSSGDDGVHGQAEVSAQGRRTPLFRVLTGRCFCPKLSDNRRKCSRPLSWQLFSKRAFRRRKKLSRRERKLKKTKRVKEKKRKSSVCWTFWMVLMTGLEPVRRKAGDFKSPVSAIPPHQRLGLFHYICLTGACQA